MATAATESHPSATPFDPAALQRLLDGRYADIRDRVREVLARPAFAPPIALPTDEYRKLVMRRARTLADEGFDAFEVFRAVQDDAVNASRARLDVVVLEAFVATIDACEDEDVARVLNLLCDLFALPNIEADKGFLREHGRLASMRTKAVKRDVNRLCNEVRRQAGPLIDALRIPDAILRAPIGLRDPAPADR